MDGTYIEVPLYEEPGDPVRLKARFENGVVLDIEITEDEANELHKQLWAALQVRKVVRDHRDRLGLACLGTPTQVEGR